MMQETALTFNGVYKIIHHFYNPADIIITEKKSVVTYMVCKINLKKF